MKYFGTDGIRLEDTKLLKTLAVKTAYALHKLEATQVVVGFDERPQGKKIASLLSKSLVILGIEVLYAGVVPSACVSYLNVINKTNFGVMITASHNTANVNGIKIFKSTGEKLTVSQEINIEMLFEKLPNKQAFKHLKTYAKSINVTPKKITSIDILPYLELLKKHTPNLTGKKIVLDCANGASKYLAKQVFDHTNANIIVLNTKKGKYINKNCGAVHPEALSAEVIKQNADIGFAFDGDADRCVCVLSDGRALSGDNALVGIAKYYKFPQIVGTIYSNGAIERVLKKEDITFHRSNVGDQAVKKLMNKTKCVFGGERSGHFIFSEFLPTGDGMFSALKIATIKNFEKSSQFKKTPTITINFPSKNKKKDLKKLTSLEKKYLSMLGKYGRIIIRPSGTENLIRVLIEHKNIKIVEKVEALLKSKFTTK